MALVRIQPLDSVVGILRGARPRTAEFRAASGVHCAEPGAGGVGKAGEEYPWSIETLRAKKAAGTEAPS